MSLYYDDSGLIVLVHWLVRHISAGPLSSKPSCGSATVMMKMIDYDDVCVDLHCSDLYL